MPPARSSQPLRVSNFCWLYFDRREYTWLPIALMFSLRSPRSYRITRSAMAFYNSSMKSSLQSSQRISRLPFRLATRLASGFMALSLSVGMALPTLAADPFRPNDSSHNIGDNTQAAFEAIFKEGNYDKAEGLLETAEQNEPNEPLVHAMLASMAYLEGDSGLPEVARRADLTKEKAQALMATDPLRGHLYTAVGTFLEGAYVLKTQGVARGTPRALGLLQQVFSEMDAAESINAADPELNLLKGYMDLLLAVNLPFSNPEEAIANMTEHGSPVYLTQRGVALGYRDLGRYTDAINAVDRAIAAAPQNPELFYLKAQILRRQGAKAASVEMFQRALDSAEQLPPALANRIVREQCGAEEVSGAQCAAREIY